MTLEQQGAYINLLARQWSDSTCSLPDDDESLARLSEMAERWLTNGSQKVRICFPAHPTLNGRIANEKLLELHLERDAWIEKSRQGGLKSGAKRRKQKHLRHAKGGSTTVPTTTPTKCEPPPQPNGNSPSPYPQEVSKDTSTPYKSPKDDAFEKWWQAFPRQRRQGKAEARKAHARAIIKVATERGITRAEGAVVLQERLEAFAATARGQGRFCLKPAHWLEQGCWDDDPAAWQDARGESQPLFDGRVYE